MKKSTKQILALLLAICSLASFAMPTVFATQGGDEPAPVPESVTYQFYNAEWGTSSNAAVRVLTAHTAEIKDAFDAGTSNWRYEGINNAYQFGRGGNAFASGTKSIEITSGVGVWFAVRIKSPGAGKFDLTYTHGAKNQGAKKGSMFILDAEVVDNKLGANAETYAAAVSADPYQGNGTTDAFAGIKDAIDEALVGKESVITSNYYAATTTTNLSETGSFVFEENKEYVVVFKAEEMAGGADSARLLLTSLTATYAADQGNVVAPTDDLTVNFKNDATTAGITVSTYFQTTSLLTAFNDAYTAKSIQWAPYTGSGTTMIHSNGYAGGAFLRWNGSKTNAVFELINDKAGDAYAALKFRAPGTGNYKLSVDYTFLSAADLDAAEAGAYILPMPQSAYTAANLAATEADGAAKATITPNSQGTCDSGEETVALVYGKEYIIVFYAKTDVARTKTDFAGFGLTFVSEYVPEETTEPTEPAETTEATEPSETTPSVEADTTTYQFYNADWKSTGVHQHTVELKTAYDNGSANWRYEACNNAYQMRPATHEKGPGQNTFASGSKSIEVMCAEGIWFAVRIQSPGDGMYDLTYTHGAKKEGAQVGSMYIIKASDVAAVLGANAQAYSEAMTADPYQENGTTDIYTAYVAAVNKALEGKASVINSNYHASSTTSGLTDTGRFGFEADTEYFVVFKSVQKVPGESTARLLISSLTATYSDDQVTGDSEAEEDTTPVVPENVYTDGLYDFYTGIKAGDTLESGIDTIATMYENGSLNWKYEAHTGINLAKSSYSSGLKSMRFISTITWWIAFRIKAPAQDGSYNIQMTHGAGGQGGVAGNIYVLPAESASNINKAIAKKGPAMTTNWFYGENSGDVISGRQSGVGTVNMEAGKEYIVVFMPTEQSAVTNNAYMWLGQLQATRVGDMVEEAEDDKDTAGYYEFYHYDYPGQYLYHYKTEEELKAKIVKDVIAKEYEEGLINWKHESSSGFANFAIGTPYLNATIGESYPFVLRIKSPGTGTYKIEYTHYVTSAAKAADYGYVYIVAATDKEYDYTTVRDECAYKDPIITTSYKADKNGFVTVTGEYTAFEEGKEYFLCFDVADNDNTKRPSIYAYPQSMQMTRTGDYKPEPGQEPDDGTVYNLMLGDEYKNKYLWHSGDQTLYNEVTKMYENGSLNWRLESIGGQAVYSAKYLKVGTGKEGGIVAFRVKAPGTGKYKVTLKYLLGTDIRDANSGEIYMIEAPEEYLDGTTIANMTARAPIATGNFSHTGNQMEKASLNGEFNMEAGKEYLFLIYLSDIEDKGNTTKSTWAYLDRIVMKWIGEFEPEPEYFNKGGLVVKDANRLFRTAGSIAITEVNGHDYLAMGVYGGTMMIYDLDEWRLVDEVLTGVNTPRGVALDKNGRFWTTGDTKKVYCYDPYTMSGQEYNLGLPGGSAYNITCGEDGYLYWSTMASTGAHLFRMNPDTLELTSHTYSGWSNYIADMDQKGDYIYAGVSGEERHEMWKINKYTFAVVDSVDITAEMMETRYIDGVEFLDDNYLWFAASSGITIIDVRTMEKLPAEQIGIDGVITRAISGELDGKRYFISSKVGLCYYDIATQTFGKVSGDVENARTALRGKDYNLATIDDERLPGKSIITFGGMGAEGVNLYAYNPENGAYVTLIGLVETSFAYGQDLREMGAGLPGSGEIYYGANYEAPVQVYNCLTNEEGRSFATNGQADAFHWYKDQLYIGNYNQAVLTRMENGEPIALFRLNNDVFYQARIHTISGGDDKVFVGTVPHVYQNGGVLAWYDLNTELTYVVTGPNPEDVYYAESSKTMATNVWYSVQTGEQIVMEEEWDKDEDGDGVCKYFKGPIPLQSITKVVYRNGLIFGLAAPMGGTSAVEPEGLTAKMFIYDVENMKMLKVFDIGDYISGLPYPLHAIASFEGDPEISNKFWGVVSETLFSMTYDFDTGKITIKEELSFDKITIKNGNGWFCNDMLFQDEYIYVMLYKKGGLCRINRNNPKEYEQLLYNFDSVKDMPSSFVLGDDGDLYYIAGTALYVLNLDITEEERAIAKSVQDAIDLIPDLETMTLADRETVEAARAAWDAMAPANQPLVKNYEKLEEAEIQLLRLRIAGLGEITIEDEAELVAIRTTYSTLTLEQRMSIDFLTVSKAESIMSILRGERMVNIIAAIGEVTLEKESVIRDARAAFMALSLYERRLVTNIDVLNAAEAVLTGLLLQKNEAANVDKLIGKIGFVFFGDGAKISAARKAYNKLDDATKALVEKHGTLVAAEIILVAEYVIFVAAVACGALYAIPATRAKIFKKKEKASTEE